MSAVSALQSCLLCPHGGRQGVLPTTCLNLIGLGPGSKLRGCCFASFRTGDSLIQALYFYCIFGLAYLPFPIITYLVACSLPFPTSSLPALPAHISSRMHAIQQQNHRHPYSSTTTHFNVQTKDETSSGSESASIDVVVVRGGDEEQDEEEHHYFAPQINPKQQNGGAHVETNPSYAINDQQEENPYFNPHYISRGPSVDSAYSSANHNAHSQHYPTANGTPIDHTPHPHYYEVHPPPPQSNHHQIHHTASGVSLIPLALVDREVHSRRVSALILPQENTSSKFARHNQQYQQQGAARTGRRRFSVTTSGGSGARKMAGEEVHYAQSQMFPPPVPQQKETLGRRAAQKFLQQKGAFRRAKPSGSKLAALGSELSQSASALYSLFTTPSTKTGESDDEDREFDRRSVLSVDHLQHHYQQPILSHQMSVDDGIGRHEQIYAPSSAQMSTKALVSMAIQTMEELTVEFGVIFRKIGGFSGFSKIVGFIRICKLLNFD